MHVASSQVKKQEATKKPGQTVETVDVKLGYELSINGYDEGDKLLITVWDEDVGTNELLGKCVIPADKLPKFDGEVQLTDGGKGFSPTLRLGIVEVKETASETLPQKLKVCRSRCF